MQHFTTQPATPQPHTTTVTPATAEGRQALRTMNRGQERGSTWIHSTRVDALVAHLEFLVANPEPTLKHAGAGLVVGAHVVRVHSRYDDGKRGEIIEANPDLTRFRVRWTFDPCRIDQKTIRTWCRAAVLAVPA